jgi:hypothetical protein
VRDRPGGVDPSVARNDRRERAQREAQLQELGDLRYRLQAQRFGKLGRGQARSKLGGLDGARQPCELVAPGLELILLGGQFEQRSRVAFGDS